MHFRVLITASLLALAGCHLHSDPPGEAPSGVVVTPGEGLVTVNWNRDPELTYWIFYQPGSSVAPAAPGVPLIFGAIPPQVVAGLTNETPYAFVMNATRGDSKAGPSSPVVVKTPRLAGAEWVSGTPLGGTTPQKNLNGIAFSGSRLVVVGDSATIFAGDYNYTSITPPGVTAWMPATSIPVSFTANLSAVTFSGQFVALGIDSSILTSADGLTWTSATTIIPPGGPNMNSIAFGAGVYVAVGDAGSIFTSPDLVNWTQAFASPPNANDLFGVFFLNNVFVATGAGGTLLTSSNGNAWAIVQGLGTASALRGAAYSASATGAHYVVVGDGGTIVTSSDGTNWTTTTLSSVPNLRSVTSGGALGTRFLAVGLDGAVVFSDDGTHWSPPSVSPGSAHLARVIFTPAMYVAVGETGTNAFSK